jgi:hypothetical protein
MREEQRADEDGEDEEHERREAAPSVVGDEFRHTRRFPMASTTTTTITTTTTTTTTTAIILERSRTRQQSPRDDDKLRRQKHQKLPVILLPDAVANPVTVMIELAHAPVAREAMFRSDRLEHRRLAVHAFSVDGRRIVATTVFFILRVFCLVSFWREKPN